MIMSDTPKNLLDVLARLQVIESLLLKNEDNTPGVVAHGEVEFVNDENIKSGNGDRRTVEHITFERPMTKIPKVYTSLAGFNTDSDWNSRVQVLAENITEEGFDLVARTWRTSNVLFVNANWIAIL
jgi:hypothetical protein